MGGKPHSDPSIKLQDNNNAKGQKVQSPKINSVHLCCQGCVDDINDALKSVAGVKSNTAKKGPASFEVTGDFNEMDVFTAIEKDGPAGKVGQ